MAAAAASGGAQREDSQRTPYSPWLEPPRRSQNAGESVVGWRSGMSLTPGDVTALLRKERRLRHEYRGLRRAAMAPSPEPSPGPVVSGQRREDLKKDQKDLAANVQLPASWHAFYSTMPHLDSMAGYRQYLKEQQQQKLPKEDQPPSEAEAEEDADQLEEEVRKRKDALQEKQLLLKELERKLAQARKRDAEAEEHSRRVARRLETASYEHGIMQGKLRSSDIYFHFLHEDAQITHSKKLGSLQRSCALMQKQIEALRGEVKALKNLDSEAGSTDLSLSAPRMPGTPTSTRGAVDSPAGTPGTPGTPGASAW